jgi:hypothetical protein
VMEGGDDDETKERKRKEVRTGIFMQTRLG